MSVGVIGGADGPTAILVSKSPVFGAVPIFLVAVAVIAIAAIVFFAYKRK